MMAWDDDELCLKVLEMGTTAVALLVVQKECQEHSAIHLCQSLSTSSMPAVLSELCGATPVPNAHGLFEWLKFFFAPRFWLARGLTVSAGPCLECLEQKH
jgi:hypothetical protein